MAKKENRDTPIKQGDQGEPVMKFKNINHKLIDSLSDGVFSIALTLLGLDVVALVSKMSLRIAKKNPKATEIQVQGVGGITYSQLVAVAKALK